MHNRNRVLVGVAALLVVALFMSTQVASQEQPGQKSGADAAAEMMAKWKSLNSKGPAHERFNDMVGTWDIVNKMWMAPGSEPVVSRGTARYRLILDGRYLEQQYKSESMGEMFEGLGIEGYDNYKQKYVAMWTDNQSTGIFLTEGTADPTGKSFTYLGKMDDPMTGQKDKPMKSVARIITDDEVVFEMYDTIPGVGEVITMEINYKRRK